MIVEVGGLDRRDRPNMGNALQSMGGDGWENKMVWKIEGGGGMGTGVTAGCRPRQERE